jgi:hypothetical protein
MTGIEKAAAAVVQQVKRIRLADERGGDAIGAHLAVRELREHLGALERLSSMVEVREGLYSDRADKQFLELESTIRDSCAKRGWRVDGQWPTFYVERAIAVEVSETKRNVSVAGKKLSAPTAEVIVAALEPLVRELVPKGFSAKDFMRELAAAYDATRGGSAQLPIFDLYRGFVVHSQGTRFWRDARTDAFVGLSADQFRARLSAALEAGVTGAPDGREIRLLPPLNPKDGLFMNQPAESRYGFVGRVEFMPAPRSEAS